jgi:hypothetical protein
MKRGVFRTACVAFVVLLTLASSTAAQVPHKKKDLTRADREAWYKILRWPDEYEKTWGTTHSQTNEAYGGLNFYELGRGVYIVEVNTYTGAYQSGYIFLLYDETKKGGAPAPLLKFKRFGEDEQGRPEPSFEEEIAGTPTFDTLTKQLEIYSKYRGPGDCGSLINYKFVNGNPLVVSAREQTCDDSKPPPDEIDPRRWPRKKL